MAVQIPDPGTGNGNSGDNEYVFRKKVQDNFTDQANAASRVVGSVEGDLAELKNRGVGGSPTPMGCGWGGVQGQFGISNTQLVLDELISGGSRIFRNSLSTDLNTGYDTGIFCHAVDSYFTMSVAYSGGKVTIASGLTSEGSPVNIQEVYTNKNVTKDSNGFLKGASPVVGLYNDKAELNDDAKKQPIAFEKVSVGNYLIKGSLGFAQEGWYIETPKDANGNVLVAVVYTQLANNDISIKTYAKRFDEDTGDIVANLAKPRDIPAGRFISLRLHELPAEPASSME